MPKKKMKWYIGLHRARIGVAYHAFQTSISEPTQSDFPIYMAIIGPFWTKRACLWAEKYGYNNPHFQTVDDAERISKEESLGHLCARRLKAKSSSPEK